MLSRSQRIAEEIYVRIKGLPKSPSSGHIRDIRNEHLNQLINISGVVTRRSGVFPQLKISWFDCLACMSTFGPFVQNQEKEFRPNRCPQCQSKGGFQVNAERTIYRNYQKVTLQEAPGTVPPGRLPRHKDVALLGDLIDKVRPGQKIEVTGNSCSTAARAWRCRAHSLSGIYSNRFDASLNMKNGFPVFATLIEANYVLNSDDEKSQHLVTEEERAVFTELATRPNIFARLVSSIAPSIHGHDDIKTALLLSMYSFLNSISPLS